MSEKAIANAQTPQQMMSPMAAPAPANAMLSIFNDPKSFEIAMNMAQALSASTIVPTSYQKNPSNCLIAIEMAARINTSPMMVMQNLFVVNGRPSWSSQWIISMINSSKRYKTELQFKFGNDPADGGLSCQAWAEDRYGHIVEGPKVTMKMAEAEGWVSKNGSKWKTMPEVMIQYRAASFFGRMNCPDMIMGIYSAEESLDMGDFVAVDGTGLQVDPGTGEVIETPIEVDEKIGQKDRQKLFEYAKQYLGTGFQDKLKEILSRFGYESTTDLPFSIYNKVIAQIVATADVPEADGDGEAAES